MGIPRYTVLHAPGLATLAQQLASELEGTTHILCTSDVLPKDDTGLCWDAFPSGDPNVKLRVDAIRDRHVVFVMNHDTAHLFEQMAVLLFLQRFNVPLPDPEQAKLKWKQTMREGAYDECSAASITVIVPWYRHCQMERTCRWTVSSEGKWYNGLASGEFVDVPTCQSFAAMLSALPIPGSRCSPPQQLLLVDIHEYEDLQLTLDNTHRWSNHPKKYDFVEGSGTYFASAFKHFLSHWQARHKQDDVATSFVVFPDGGAHRRFYTMVLARIAGIRLENILWIQKSRVGTDITQADGFLYLDAQGHEQPRVGRFADGSTILIADDFTNSGGTLFGAAETIRRHAATGASLRVCAYVSHFVATYDRAKVTAFVGKLYSPAAPLDEFHCTDSIPNVVGWLNEEVDARVAAGALRKAHVMPLAPVLADWIRSNPPQRHAPRRKGSRPRGLSPSQRRRLSEHDGWGGRLMLPSFVGVGTTLALMLSAAAVGVGMGWRGR